MSESKEVMNAFDDVRFGMNKAELTQLENELKFALKSYKGYLNWVCYTTYPRANEVMEVVNRLMTSKKIWIEAKRGVVQDTINRCKHLKARFVPLELIKKNYGMLRTFTYKFMGGMNSLSEDPNSGALVGRVTAYQQSRKDIVNNQKTEKRLKKIKGVFEHKIFDESGQVINKQVKGRDINAIVSLIEKQTGINILAGPEFIKYPAGKKISAINQVMAYSERSKKFSLENDMVGKTLLDRFEKEIYSRTRVIDI